MLTNRHAVTRVFVALKQKKKKKKNVRTVVDRSATVGPAIANCAAEHNSDRENKKKKSGKLLIERTRTFYTFYK